MSLKALLFDVDGTLAETERYGHRPAYNRAFRTLGLGFRWNSDLYRVLLHQPGGRERLLHYVRHYRPDLGAHAKTADSDVEAWVDQVHHLKTQYFREYLKQGRMPLRPGVRRLIREAHAAGLKVALVSNASRRSLDSLLSVGSASEVRDSIDLVIDGDQVKCKKPSPESYLLAMRRLNVHAGECVALEDSAEGLRAAHSARIPTIITVNSNTRRDDFSFAALVLSHLGEPELPTQVLRGQMTASCVTLDVLQNLLGAQAKAA